MLYTPVKLVIHWYCVCSLQIFVKDNHSGEEVTQIDHLALFGTPVSATNMADFKRVRSIYTENHLSLLENILSCQKRML